MYVPVSISAFAYKCLMQKHETIVLKNDNELKEIALFKLCELEKSKELICMETVCVA